MSNERSTEEGGERLVFALTPNRNLIVNVQIAMSTPVVPGVPPRPKQPGDSALAVVLDEERMLLVQYGFEDTMQSTPVVSGSPPGRQT
jgi:hypothetical protein